MNIVKIKRMSGNCYHCNVETESNLCGPCKELLVEDTSGNQLACYKCCESIVQVKHRIPYYMCFDCYDGCLVCGERKDRSTNKYSCCSTLCSQELKVLKRTYIEVPYTERNAAKSLGAKFDPKYKKWFIYQLPGTDNILSKWATVSRDDLQEHIKIYFDIPFADKNDAKQLGARWDPTYKAWYANTREIADELHKRWETL